MSGVKTIETGELTGIRWHGRGGQGAVTSAELLAQAAIAEGKYAQAFPSFGPERRGAPVQAFNRVSNQQPIRVRAGITRPDIVVVLDSGLLGIADVTSGLKTGGTLVINTRKTFVEIEAGLGSRWRLALIDATIIARELLGAPIVNTTMLGALIRATGVVKLESLFEPLEKRFGRMAEKNINAMKKAYQETLFKEKQSIG
jgi:pyruvate ferredoxin oxidoreductase gamma subunit